MSSTTSFIMTHLLFVVTLIAGGAITTLHANFSHVAKANIPSLYVQTGPPAPNTGTDKKHIDEISDILLFASSAGGALIGAYVGIAFGMIPVVVGKNERRSAKIAQAFSVSLCTGLLLAPAMVNYYLKPCHWTLAFLAGGLVASGAWLILGIWKAILNRFMTRAEKDGIGGLIDEAARAKQS